MGIKAICNVKVNGHLWFNNRISCNLGNRVTINFWDHCCLGATPLKEMFSIVYEACVTTSLNIANMGYWEDSIWHLDLIFDEFALLGEAGEEWSVLVSTLMVVKPNVSHVVGF